MLHTRDLVIRKQPHWLRLAVVLCSVLLMNPYATPAEPEPSRENEESDRPSTTVEDGKTGKSERPDMGRLLELNGAAIFGGSVKTKGERLEITFNKTGQMLRGFTGKGIHDSDSDLLKGSNRKFIQVGDKKGGRGGRGRGGDKEEKLLPGLAVLGYEKGLWVSRFPLKGDTWVNFGFRLPNLISGQSSFAAIVNWDPKKRSGYQTSFFQSIAKLSRGRPISRRMTRIKQYRRPPNDWFPRKGESVQIGFGIQEGSCIVEMEGKENVRYPVKKDQGGHVSFAFNKLVFTLDNLVITGNMDREWCEKEIAKLRKSGELIEKSEK